MTAMVEVRQQLRGHEQHMWLAFVSIGVVIFWLPSISCWHLDIKLIRMWKPVIGPYSSTGVKLNEWYGVNQTTD